MFYTHLGGSISDEREASKAQFFWRSLDSLHGEVGNESGCIANGFVEYSVDSSEMFGIEHYELCCMVFIFYAVRLQVSCV